MKILLTLIICLVWTGLALAHVHTEEVVYRQGDTELKGFLAYNTDVEEPAPGVLVVHEWWGLNDYAKRRAKMLAEAGYVALALDMYGEGKSTEHPEEASEWAGWVRQNAEAGKQRFLAALAVLQEDERVDAGRVAAIGYCFGGHVVLSMAMTGVDLTGVVSFHGSLPQDPVPEGSVPAKILVCHGAADPLVSAEQIETFQDNLAAAGADWQFNAYGGAKHSFTSPAADERGMDAVAYSPSADMRSWQAMITFFEEIFSQ